MCSSDLGEAISKIFFEEGSKVCVIDNNLEKLESLEKKINSNSNLITFNFDVSDEEKWKNCVSTTLRKWKKIEVI